MRRAICYAGMAVLGAAGAVPGAAAAWAVSDPAYLGFALLGGLASLGLGASGLIYRTTLGGTVRRVAKGVAFTLIEYNVGHGRQLAGLEREPSGESLLCPGARPTADPRAFNRALEVGFAWGAGVASVLAFGLGWYLKRGGALDRAGAGVVCALIAAVVGGAIGAAVLLLTVPGRHRVRALWGLAGGAAIGCGPLAVALGPPLPSAELVGWGLLGLFTFAGLWAGLSAAESQPRSVDEPQPSAEIVAEWPPDPGRTPDRGGT
jgi:hypothetical protein